MTPRMILPWQKNLRILVKQSIENLKKNPVIETYVIRTKYTTPLRIHFTRVLLIVLLTYDSENRLALKIIIIRTLKSVFSVTDWEESWSMCSNINGGCFG